MKCILLVRVSTEQQSFDEQERELLALAQKCGYKKKDITAVAYKESAIKLTEEARAGLNDMKQLIETGEYDRVFAWEISRIARRKKILFSILEYLTTRGIQLTIKEPYLDLLNPDGSINEGSETVFTLYAQLAESEMRNKLARFKRGHTEGYNKGMYMGGKITKGYKVNEQGYWEIDEEGAKFIRLIFDLYNSGQYSLTELGHELKARGYFENLSITNTKNEISHILKNPIYIGIRTSNNIYPAIIDKETWDKCAARRAANRHKPKPRHQYLLTQLIRCECGGSYSVSLHDGTYICRVRHNAVEKDIPSHSPAINGNVIESLAWWVALQELHIDMSTKQEDVKVQHEAEISVLKQKIEHSEALIKSTQERRSQLDEQYFVLGRFSEERYTELTAKQNDLIKKEQENLRRYKAAIANLEKQIEYAITFDELIDSINDSFDTLKEGTDFDIMKSIVRRYIKEINIEPIEGKKTSWWKRVIFHTAHSEDNQKRKDELIAMGETELAETFSNEFTVDVYHHIVYFDRECTNQVPYVYMERIPRLRVDTRKGRKRNKTQQKQYE